jgi:hypothetical protein
MPRLMIFGICDDVRAEQGNKMTIVGYYGQSINVGVFPAVLPKLCFFAQFDSLDGATVFTARIISPSGGILIEIPNAPAPAPMPSVVPPEYRHRILVFQIAPMSLNEQGEYRVEYDFQIWPIFTVSFFVGLDRSLVQGAAV